MTLLAKSIVVICLVKTKIVMAILTNVSQILHTLCFRISSVGVPLNG